jgi:hypothetical protein
MATVDDSNQSGVLTFNGRLKLVPCIDFLIDLFT